MTDRSLRNRFIFILAPVTQHQFKIRFRLSLLQRLVFPLLWSGNTPPFAYSLNVLLIREMSGAIKNQLSMS